MVGSDAVSVAMRVVFSSVIRDVKDQDIRLNQCIQIRQDTSVRRDIVMNFKHKMATKKLTSVRFAHYSYNCKRMSVSRAGINYHTN